MPVPLPPGVAEALAEVKVSSWQKKKKEREVFVLRVESTFFLTAFQAPFSTSSLQHLSKNFRPRSPRSSEPSTRGSNLQQQRRRRRRRPPLPPRRRSRPPSPPSPPPRPPRAGASRPRASTRSSAPPAGPSGTTSERRRRRRRLELYWERERVGETTCKNKETKN